LARKARNNMLAIRRTVDRQARDLFRFETSATVSPKSTNWNEAVSIIISSSLWSSPVVAAPWHRVLAQHHL
jgi:hypothetical protein